MVSIKNFFIINLVLLLITSCNSGKDKKAGTSDKNKAPISIDVSIANFQTFVNTVEANGNVLANEFVQLKPEMNGRVVFLNIQEGKTVAEGTVLLRLFNDDLKAQERKLISQQALAIKTEQRLNALLDKKGINQQDYDNALTQVQNLNADIDYIRSQIRKTEIRAPFAGVIGLRHVSPGSYITTQDIVASMQETKTLKIDFVIPEAYASTVKTGDEVKIIADDETVYSARVIGIEPLVNSISRNLQIRAVVIQTQTSLRPGAFVKVEIDVAKGKKSILVPSNCIIPETRFKKIAVVKMGKIEMVTVETGYRGENKVEITKGLNQGDTFAINGILYLKPGADITVKSVKP